MLYFQDAKFPIHITLSRIQELLEVKRSEFRDWIQATDREIDHYLSGQRKIQISQIENLSKNLSLSIEAIGNGDIDYPALADRIAKREPALPEKYKLFQFSRSHTASAVIRYLNQHKGHMSGLRAIRRLQIPTSLLSNPNQSISPILLADLLQESYRYGLNEHDFRSIGHASASLNRETALGKSASVSRNLVELHEKLVLELIRSFDQNNDYSIESISKDHCTIVSKPREPMRELLPRLGAGSKFGCIQRLGVIESFPNYIKRSRSSARHTHCVHRGDPVCRYRVEFPTLNSTLRPVLNAV